MSNVINIHPTTTTVATWVIRYWFNSTPDEVGFVQVAQGNATEVFTDIDSAADRAVELADAHREFTYEVVPNENSVPSTLPPPVVDTTVEDNLRTTIQALQTELFDLKDHLVMLARQHQQDIENISERLISEANRRDWCGEYDTIVDDLNGSLNVPLLTRAKDYTVTFTIEIEVDVAVSARDEDRAHREAVQQLDADTIIAHLRADRTAFSIENYDVNEDED